ncbi:MAG: GNAT family N-acetyltransferase [Pseudomonadales bacterium]|nr:GNAT family N-acetyltransferase [Pseudomonadales bacterium]
MADSETNKNLILEEVIQADRPILDRLLQNYLKEFSNFNHQEKDASGRYPYPYLNYYWQDPDRHPYFFKQSGKICGFALVRKDRDPAFRNETMELAEFYIIDSHRRRGNGQQVAVKLWDLFPSQWKVSIMLKNQSAVQFWAKTISDYSEDKFELINNEEKDLITYVFFSRVYLAST